MSDDPSSSAGIQVAQVADVPADQGLVISSDVTGHDDDISLFRDEDGSVRAIDDTCSHQTASLAFGWVEGGYVECPLHASRFCLRDGKVDGLPAVKDVRAHKVEERDGAVWLFPGTPPE